MSYRHPSGDSSTLSSAEFTSPSLQPFYCAYAAGATTSSTADEVEFVTEFMNDVLLHLKAERWELVDAIPEQQEEKQSIDLTLTQQSSATSSSSRQQRMAISYNVILSQLDTIMRHKDTDKHYSVEMSALECLNADPRLTSLLLSYPTKFLPLIDESLQLFQRSMYDCPSNDTQVHGDASIGLEPVWTKKENIHARLHSLPLTPDRVWKTSLASIHASDAGHLIQMSGTVIRTGLIRMVESQREYECSKCQHKFMVWSDLDQGHSLTLPDRCPAPGRKKCKNAQFTLIAGSAKPRDYQRIKVQDGVMKLALGTMPKSIYITMHDDLVDRVHAGDEVDIVGVIRRHWLAPFWKENPCQCELYIDAIHVRVKHDRRQGVNGSSRTNQIDSYLHEFREYWRQNIDQQQPLLGRNLIVSSFCPKLYGLFSVKLAVMLTLIGGVQHTSATGTKVRGECHLLLVGDAGTGKSQLLKFATKVSQRSILTTGMGTTSAGLTVAAVQEPGGEWGLEAGALVLADGGVCCIDEFGCIRDHDRATIHEAMEQQTVSMAKAGLVCTLNTRTTVFGAMNPKGSYDHDADLSVNTSLASPLLSRFDLVLLMLDKRNAAWDEQVVGYIMGSLEKPIEEEVWTMTKQRFEQEAKERRVAMEANMTQQGSQSQQTEAPKELRAWNVEKLQAYIQYIRYHIDPILTPLAQRLLTRYYQHQRAADSRSAARTTIRLLESLVRLTQAHARLMWHTQRATAMDACMAIFVMETSLQSCAIASTRDGIALGTFLRMDDIAHSPDEAYQQQYTYLLSKLDIQPDEYELESEGAAEDENAVEWHSEGQIEQQRLTRQQAEQQRRENEVQLEASRKYEENLREQQQMNQPLTFSALDNGAATATLAPPITTITTTVDISNTQVPLRRPTPSRPPPAAASSSPAAAAAPSRRPTAAASSLRPIVHHPTFVSTQVPYDPFQSVNATQIPALSSTQLQKELENAATTTTTTGDVEMEEKKTEQKPKPKPKPTTSRPRPPPRKVLPPVPNFDGTPPSSASSSSSAVISNSPARTSTAAEPAPAPAPINNRKRPRLGVAAPRAPPPTTAMVDSDDDEDKPIIMLSQSGSKRQKLQQQVVVKKEVMEDVEDKATQDCGNLLAAFASQRSLMKPAQPQTPEKPKVQVDPKQQLQQLLESGMSKDQAESILNNPLRVAAFSQAPTVVQNSVAIAPTVPAATSPAPQAKQFLPQQPTPQQHQHQQSRQPLQPLQQQQPRQPQQPQQPQQQAPTKQQPKQQTQQQAPNRQPQQLQQPQQPQQQHVPQQQIKQHPPSLVVTTVQNALPSTASSIAITPKQAFKQTMAATTTMRSPALLVQHSPQISSPHVASPVVSVTPVSMASPSRATPASNPTPASSSSSRIASSVITTAGIVPSPTNSSSPTPTPPGLTPATQVPMSVVTVASTPSPPPSVSVPISAPSAPIVQPPPPLLPATTSAKPRSVFGLRPPQVSNHLGVPVVVANTSQQQQLVAASATSTAPSSAPVSAPILLPNNMSVVTPLVSTAVPPLVSPLPPAPISAVPVSRSLVLPAPVVRSKPLSLPLTLPNRAAKPKVQPPPLPLPELSQRADSPAPMEIDHTTNSILTTVTTTSAQPISAAGAELMRLLEM